ncbi:hypothetical protein OPQ81_008495 [Rhizoctonia solani]|nr:hypothetical protein OPQ81_008495 [Rhizoctonia solani]
MVEQLQGFLSTRLLVWMEVLNLTKQIKAGMESMKMAAEWCIRFEGFQELADLARDSKRFIETFVSNAVSQSTPHIYMSMLAFWPDYAPISKHYRRYDLGPVKVKGPGLDRRQLAYLSTWAFDGCIGALSVSPDEESLALGHGSEVQVVDSSSGRQLLGPLKGHTNLSGSISFTPDGTRLFTASTNLDNATIIGWGTRTGETVLGPLELHGHTESVRCVSFSPDCTRIATGSIDKTPQNTIDVVAFSPDGTRIAAGASGTLQVWNTQTEDTVLGPLTDLDPIHMIAFSPDQSRVICASRLSEYKTIYVRDAQSGDKILGLIDRHTSAILCIGCSPDGRYIVSGSFGGTVQVWDAQNGNLVLGPLQGHTGSITSVTSHLMAVVLLWMRPWACMYMGCPTANLALSPINTPSDRITCVKFSSDGARFVTGSWEGTLSIWDASTGEMVLGPVKAHPSQVNAVDFLNDRIVSGSKDGAICVWDALSGEVVLGPLQVHPGAIGAISYSPNGELIATASDGGVDVWDGQNGSRVLGPLTDLDGRLLSVRFSPDGTRIVACCLSGGKNLVVWDVSDGSNVFGNLQGHIVRPISVSYSPNGALIASGSHDGTIIVWDAYTGKMALQQLKGNSGSVFSVEFSPDSTRLVSGSDDRKIRIWDVQTGEMVFELPHGHDALILSVAYSPDGTRILSYSIDMSVRIHDARTPQERELSHSASEFGDWTVNKDGWVVDDQSRLLVWVPGDLRKALMWPRTQTMVGPQGYVRLRFDKASMGESWTSGYLSRM